MHVGIRQLKRPSSAAAPMTQARGDRVLRAHTQLGRVTMCPHDGLYPKMRLQMELDPIHASARVTRVYMQGHRSRCPSSSESLDGYSRSHAANTVSCDLTRANHAQ